MHIGEYCLQFASLAYELTNGSRGGIYELNYKRWKELINLRILRNFQRFKSYIYRRKYQPSKVSKLPGGKKVNEP